MIPRNNAPPKQVIFCSLSHFMSDFAFRIW